MRGLAPPRQVASAGTRTKKRAIGPMALSGVSHEDSSWLTGHLLAASYSNARQAFKTLARGCFWCHITDKEHKAISHRGTETQRILDGFSVRKGAVFP